MNKDLKERLYRNTMEITTLSQLLDKEREAFAKAHDGARPDFAKLSIISSKMAILFHKMETVWSESEKIREELEKEIYGE